MVENKNYVGEIVSYLEKNLRKGYTKESLKWALINQGHSKMEVEKAIIMVDKRLAKKAPVLETKPEIIFEQVEPRLEEKRPFWKKFFR